MAEGDAQYLAGDAVVPVELYRVVEVKMCYANPVPECIPGDLKVPGIRCGKTSFVFLCSEKVDGMNIAIFLCQLNKMAFEGRLRGLWSRNLDSLTERLQSLLFPKN